MQTVELSAKVHPQLEEQYSRYRFMFVALALSGFLPLFTLAFLYWSGAGFERLGHSTLTVFVIFILEVPLCAYLGYLLGVKRMKYLRRSTYLIEVGKLSDVKTLGLFKRTSDSGFVTCCVDIVDDTTGALSRLMIIPTKDVQSVIEELPELENIELPLTVGNHKPFVIKAFVDKENASIAAIDFKGTILFVSPPLSLRAK